jgi:FMN reductase
MLVVGIGGTGRLGSTTEVALRVTLAGLKQSGAEVKMFSAEALRFPLYDPLDRYAVQAAGPFLEAIQAAEGVVLASPGYHGTVSGLVKNACDYLEELSAGPRPYLSDRPVGCIAVAHGWQGAVNTLRTLRDIVHSLRGWPTPYGAAINATDPVFADGKCVNADVRRGLLMIGEQVHAAALQRAAPPPLQQQCQ